MRKKSNNKAGRWLITFFVLLTLLLSGTAALQITVDPYFHYHAPEEGRYYDLYNERYQNDGIAKHFDYDAVICGTSVTQVFKTSEFDELFGVKSVKIPLSGETYYRINQLIEASLKSKNDVKIVIRSFDDAWTTSDPTASRYEEYPDYLYNDNPFDDVYYLFNKDVLIQDTARFIIEDRKGTPAAVFDNYKNWAKEFEYNRLEVLRAYKRPPVADRVAVPTEAQRQNARDNLEMNFLSLIREYPETDFYIFAPPYCSVQWDARVRNKRMDFYFEIIDIYYNELTKYDNVYLFDWNDRFEITTDLNYYRDTIHYNGEVNSMILEWMKNGEGRMTQENYRAHFEKIKDFYESYDFDGEVFFDS